MPKVHENVALYAGSFDPLTLGHLDVIKRASKLFPSLIVAVGAAREKKPLFPVEERVELIRTCIAELKNVKVESFSGLAVNFARSHNVVAMIRGVRSTADYAYEVQMALMNRAMTPEIETIFIPTSPQFSHISSSLAKEIAIHGGDMSLLVPPLVARKLAEKIKS
jgi:pantetheine-phosphate adenylyltransferase